VYRLTLVLPALLLFALALPAQQQPNSTSTTERSSAYAAIPVTAAKAPNPFKATPESLARGKKWWTIDCAVCHGDNGNGKSDTAKDMKITLADFTDPAALKDHTDGELYYLIKKGSGDMPPEGDRINTEEGWDLVNYVRSLGKKKVEAEAKSESETKPQ
jgi:mono/diheme cytochrome c family protein